MIGIVSILTVLHGIYLWVLYHTFHFSGLSFLILFLGILGTPVLAYVGFQDPLSARSVRARMVSGYGLGVHSIGFSVLLPILVWKLGLRVGLMISEGTVLRMLGHVYTVTTPHLMTVWVWATLILSLYAVWNARRLPVIRSMQIPIAKSIRNPVRIVHISDVHLDPTTSIKWSQAMVDRVMDQHPDIILITGDLVDSHIQMVVDHIPIFRQLTAPLGVWGVTGNHEYYHGVSNFKEFIAQTHIQELHNESVICGSKICLVGIPDRTSQQVGLERQDLLSAFSCIDRTLPVVFLHHQPTLTQEAMNLGADLQLSGHTHAGQFFPWNIVVRWIFAYHWGLFRIGKGWIYTTCGVGTWGAAMRLGSRSEIGVLELHQMA